MQLICGFVSVYAESSFSHDTAQLILLCVKYSTIGGFSENSLV